MQEEKSGRSVCLKIGAFILIRKIVCGYKQDEMANRMIGKVAGLFLDLAAYSTICEDNALQYYRTMFLIILFFRRDAYL